MTRLVCSATRFVRLRISKQEQSFKVGAGTTAKNAGEIIRTQLSKAAACLRDDADRLFAYYRFPHASWIHLRTTNPIESIFSPIRNRTDAMKRLRTSRFATAVLLALVSKLSKNWRRLRGYRDLYELATKPVALKRAA